jgi:hypothetical protein
MRVNHVGVQILRWALVISLVIVGLWFLNVAAYHAWAGGGPPTPNPKWHIMWADRFFALSLGSFILAATAAFTLRRRAV